MAKLSKIGREHLNLMQHMAEQWKNPPAPFNPLYNAKKQARKKAMEKMIRDNLNYLHDTLKHTPTEEYYNIMDAREALLRKSFDSEYNRII